MNLSNNKVLQSKGNVEKCKIDKTDKIKKFTERFQMKMVG